MKTLPKRHHKVAVIPLWLAEALAENAKPIETALCFADLATILSIDDVCFYYHYLKKLNFYTENAFEDMENIIYSEANAAWVIEHQSRIDATSSTFSISFDTNVDKISTTEAPSTIRKVDFKPVAHGDDTLILVGYRCDTTPILNDFYSDCMGVLGSQMHPNQAARFTVFKNYTLS